MVYVLAVAIAITLLRYGFAVRRERSFHVLAELPAGALAGLLAGVWLGIAARGAMRVIMLVAGGPARSSFSGSLQVVFTFALFGAGLGILYVGLFRHALASSGLAFGVLVLLVSWYPLSEAAVRLLSNRPPADKLLLGSGAVLCAMWLPFSLLLEAATARLHQSWAGQGEEALCAPKSVG